MSVIDNLQCKVVTTRETNASLRLNQEQVAAIIQAWAKEHLLEMKGMDVVVDIDYGDCRLECTIHGHKDS